VIGERLAVRKLICLIKLLELLILCLWGYYRCLVMIKILLNLVYHDLMSEIHWNHVWAIYISLCSPHTSEYIVIQLFWSCIFINIKMRKIIFKQLIICTRIRLHPTTSNIFLRLFKSYPAWRTIIIEIIIYYWHTLIALRFKNILILLFKSFSNYHIVNFVFELLIIKSLYILIYTCQLHWFYSR
jgi:hypothetical protein